MKPKVELMKRSLIKYRFNAIVFSILVFLLFSYSNYWRSVVELDSRVESTTDDGNMQNESEEEQKSKDEEVIPKEMKLKLEQEASEELPTLSEIENEMDGEQQRAEEEKERKNFVKVYPSRRSNITLSLKLKSTNEQLLGRQNSNNIEFREGIHLITTFYKGKYSKARMKEMVVVLRRNLKNPHLSFVHTLFEDVDPIEYVPEKELNTKLIRSNFTRQPAYKDMFDYANIYLKRGTVGIVSNSDVHFDDTLKCVKPVPQNRKVFNSTKMRLIYALSRHPALPCNRGKHDMCEEYIGSHDAFVFAPPLNSKIVSHLDFTQNHIGAENIVIWELKNAYQVKNPCHVVNALHLHCTNERSYRSASISKGRWKIGDVDRHGAVMPSRLPKCGQVLY